MQDNNSNSDFSPLNEDLTPTQTETMMPPNRAKTKRDQKAAHGPIQKLGAKWRGLGLRTKATALAIVISTIPVVTVGSLAYYTASSALNEEAQKTEKGHTVELADKVNRYMADRYTDIRAMARKAEFADAKARGAETLQSRSAVLNQLLELYQVYDSIAIFDLNGNVLGQSQGEKLGNHREYDYFKQAVNGGKAFVSVAQSGGGTGEGRAFYAVAPIRDKQSQKIVGVIRARKPVESLTEIIETILSGEEEEYSLIGPNGTIFLSNSEAKIGTQAVEDIPKLLEYVKGDEFAQFIGFDQVAGKEELVSYAPFEELKGITPLNWSAMVEIPTAVVEAPQRLLFIEIALGTFIMAALVGAAASILTGRAIRPILATSKVVEDIGDGDLDSRVMISGEDEISALGENINQMAAQIQGLLDQQAESAAREMESQAELAQQQTEAAKTEAANQAELIRQQTEAAEELKLRNQSLQNDLVRLLSEVEGASDGDLTVRAEISDGEIGIIGDFFNSIIENLGEIVAQVKTSSAQVNTSIGNNEETMELLSEEAKAQAEKINSTLQSIENMALSVQNVARNAKEAAEVAAIASMTAQKGGQTMDRTVESILNLRETVSSTSKKVKRLGESSQQISKAVSLINQIALQTNLLAINASIEAARAGEEGRGFAVVAEEVGALAAQSASATKEIEQIVETIQQETGDVVDAMEQGTTQVVEGTRQVEEAKQSLQDIVKESQQIDELLKLISESTVSQTVTSNDVKELMQQITQASERTFQTSQEVSDALRATVQVAQGLESSVDTFKVNA